MLSLIQKDSERPSCIEKLYYIRINYGSVILLRLPASKLQISDNVKFFIIFRLSSIASLPVIPVQYGIRLHGVDTWAAHPLHS